jgi:succinate dehydrogenase/fumarate reductase-like Fe-S protein
MTTGGANATGAARTLAARRACVSGECSVCGNAIQGTRRRRYCCNRCAARAYRERRDEGRIASEVVEELERIRDLVMCDRHFDDDSTDILREAREGRALLP